MNSCRCGTKIRPSDPPVPNAKYMHHQKPPPAPVKRVSLAPLTLEGEGTYIHSLIYQNLIENWLRDHPDETYPGDVMITNDPYSDASHLPDVYTYRPIFVDDVLTAWAVGGGHQRDVGGMTPGSCP